MTVICKYLMCFFMTSRCQVSRQVRPTVSVCRLSMRPELDVLPCPPSQSLLRPNQVSRHVSRDTNTVIKKNHLRGLLEVLARSYS